VKKKAVILANGEPPPISLLRAHFKSASMFVCADGGSNTAARYNLKPQLIIGDLDSITAGTLNKFKHVPTRRIAEQNSTDLEKAIRWLIRKNFKDIVVLGALGKRFDHSIGNLSALVKFSRVTQLTFVDNRAELTFVGRSCTFAAPPGTIVSLIPIKPCEGITTTGLKWELKNETLALGFRGGTSNIVNSSPVRIRVRRGDLVLYQLTGHKAVRNRSRSR
jgi:thiamine pyrophosphokinase